MRVLFLAALAALLVGAPGCSLIVDDCLYDDFGCDLPGRWALTSVNGEAITGTGYIEIEEDYIPGDGYLDLPTGLPETDNLARIRGPFLGSYSGYAVEGETRTFRFDLSLTGVPCSIGNCIVNIYTRFGDTDGDQLTLIVGSVDDDLVQGLRNAPYLRSGSVWAFRRTGRSG